MITTVFLKSTVRPWPSVRRPSSSNCSRTLKTSAMRLFDFVEEDHRVRAPAHGFGQLTALIVADVSRRGSDQPRDRVLLHVFGHVDANHRGFVVEEEFGQRAGQFGFADPGRAQEDERPDRTVRILQAGARANHRVSHRGHGLILSDHALVQMLFQMEQLLHLAFHQARHRHAGPSRDDFGDILLVNFFFDQARSASVVSGPFRIRRVPFRGWRACHIGVRRPC